jgi:hypothetical protein
LQNQFIIKWKFQNGQISITSTTMHLHGKPNHAQHLELLRPLGNILSFKVKN